MEIKSEPKYDTINVTDIDIAFPGDLQTYTLREGVDSFEETDSQMVITLGTVGTITFYKPHAHWLAKRTRVIRVLAPDIPKTPE